MAFDFPDQFRFADSHEYVRQEAELVRVGLSAYAVDQLGDIVFVDVPELGSELSRGTSFGTVESAPTLNRPWRTIQMWVTSLTTACGSMRAPCAAR